MLAPMAKAKRSGGATVTKKTARPAKVEVVIDRKSKLAWESLSKAMHDAKREESGGFDAYWEAVQAIIDHTPPLYLAGGFATARAFLAKVVGEKERTAFRMMRVARFASPDDETRYGTSKLDLALTYLAAKGLDLDGPKIPVDFARLKIPATRDGKAQQLGLAEATVAEIAAATRSLARKGRAPKKAASAVQEAIEAGLRKSASLRAVGVQHARGEITLRGIPEGQWASFVKAAAKVTLPAAE
jgi:hypothetical protein